MNQPAVMSKILEDYVCFTCQIKFTKQAPQGRKTSSDGNHYCSKCNAKRQNAAHVAKHGPTHKNPRYADQRPNEQANHLKSKYGMTLADYEELLARQNGKCAICGAHETDQHRKRFDVDHEHETRKIRGLLCGCCNRGLGQFKDNPQFLLRAYLYFC